MRRYEHAYTVTSLPNDVQLEPRERCLCSRGSLCPHAQLLLAVVSGADPVVDALVQAFATNQMGCKPWRLTVAFEPVTKV